MCLQLTSQWRSIFKSSSINSHSALAEGWLPQRVLMPFAPLGYTQASIKYAHVGIPYHHMGEALRGSGEMGSAHSG